MTRFAADGGSVWNVFRQRPDLPGWLRQVGCSGPHLIGMADTLLTDPRVPVILTSQQVCEFLRVPPGTLSDWRLQKTGPAYFRFGHHVRYELTAVLAWLEEHRHE